MDDMENQVEEAPVAVASGNNPNLIVAGVVSLIVVVGVGFWLWNKQSNQKDQEIVVEAATSSPTPTATASGEIQEINVEAGSFYYKPNGITVKKGQKVRIVLNSVSMMHDFNIDELGVKIPVTKSGGKASIEFVADKVGQFVFYCSVANHRQMGQEGKLVVEE